MNNFIQLCLDGEAKPDAIDDYIEKWHTNIKYNQSQNLYEFLGMTRKEYASWIERKQTLETIIINRKKVK